VRSLSANQARRIALAAQGLCTPRPAGRVDRRHLRRLVTAVGVVQLDSVNVLTRAHHLLVWARLGDHDVAQFDRWAYHTRPAEVFESSAHESALVPVELHPLLRWKSERAAAGQIWRGLARLGRERADYVENMLAMVAALGPVTARELRGEGGRAGPWWGWDDTKRALELLVRTGRLAALRRASFERVYDLPERVLPAAVLNAPTPEAADAQRSLLARAGRHLGVATVADLADYYRIRPAEARPLVADLVEEGTLQPVSVEGWRDQAYVHADAVVRRRGAQSTLLSPFDPLVWFRPRAERLFGFRYRIEIYTPVHKRMHGYYVLPFLHRDRLRARVDLKSDRRDGSLLVQSAWLEEGEDGSDVAEALTVELVALARWLGLERVKVRRDGNLAAALALSVAGHQP
jgi:uncharacterized protein